MSHHRCKIGISQEALKRKLGLPPDAIIGSAKWDIERDYLTLYVHNLGPAVPELVRVEFYDYPKTTVEEAVERSPKK